MSRYLERNNVSQLEIAKKLETILKPAESRE
jgi:hypothetical protein